MRGYARHVGRLLAAVAACWVLVAAAPAAAAPGGSVPIKASVIKPLTLSWLQNLDLGTIVLGTGTWSGATVAISRTGALSCTNANVTCSGATTVARYNVTGTNGQVVRISAPNVTLVLQGDPTRTLTLTVDSPGTVVLPNSGSRGVDFALGGSLNLSSAVAGGTYVGTFNVTVDY